MSGYRLYYGHAATVNYRAHVLYEKRGTILAAARSVAASRPVKTLSLTIWSGAFMRATRPPRHGSQTSHYLTLVQGDYLTLVQGDQGAAEGSRHLAAPVAG